MLKTDWIVFNMHSCIELKKFFIQNEQKMPKATTLLGCFKSSWPRTKFVLFQQLGMKIFPPSNLPRWCSDKAAASWPQGRGFESRLEPNFFAQSKNRKFLKNYFVQKNWLIAGFEPVTL